LFLQKQPENHQISIERTIVRFTRRIILTLIIMSQLDVTQEPSLNLQTYFHPHALKLLDLGNKIQRNETNQVLLTQQTLQIIQINSFHWSKRFTHPKTQWTQSTSYKSLILQGPFQLETLNQVHITEQLHLKLESQQRLVLLLLSKRNLHDLVQNETNQGVRSKERLLFKLLD